MSEDFLHYIWKYKLFNLNHLLTTAGESIQIISVGEHNTVSGPDFFNAKIRIGELVWAGHVEIHISASDWFKHEHEKDPIYLKTILHVVFNYDNDVFDDCKNPIPTLELNGRIPKQLILKHDYLRLSKNKLVCQGLTNELDDFRTQQWLSRLLIERLERKVTEIEKIYEVARGNWEQTVFILLAKSLGFSVNSVPMQLVAEKIDFKILLKNRSKPSVLEAILLGVAGLLNDDFEEDYPNKLKKEFAHQKIKYSLEELDVSIWKFGGVRPSNFPTIRLVQYAQIISKFGNLFEEFVRDFKINKDGLPLNVQASKYWDSHFTLKKASNLKSKLLGPNSVNIVLINTIAPLLFFYGRETGDSSYQELAIDLLESLPAENNSIIKKWKGNNISVKRASGSQALIQLTNNYCNSKKCLTCGIGKQILQ